MAVPEREVSLQTACLPALTRRGWAFSNCASPDSVVTAHRRDTSTSRGGELFPATAVRLGLSFFGVILRKTWHDHGRGPTIELRRFTMRGVNRGADSGSSCCVLSADDNETPNLIARAGVS